MNKPWGTVFSVGIRARKINTRVVCENAASVHKKVWPRRIAWNIRVVRSFC
jgi:hypothetical protein